MTLAGERVNPSSVDTSSAVEAPSGCKADATNPLVSVLVLTYNNVDDIFVTLDSIFEQDYPRIQIIVSDDGSRGFGSYIGRIETYAAEHAGSNLIDLTVNALPSNVGTVRNTNCALASAQGDYIISLASEDAFIHSGVLSEYVEFMQANSWCDICFGKLRGVMPDGEYRYELLSCDTDYDKLRNFDGHQTLNHLFRRNFLPAPAAFVRASSYERFGLYDEEIRLIEDYPYWISASLQGARFGYIDDYTVDYMLSGVSSSGDYSEQFILDLIAVYDKYIFPNDRRFGRFQGAYNGLKRWGLDFYLAKSRWDGYGSTRKAIDAVRFSPLFAFTGVQKALNELKNRRASR